MKTLNFVLLTLLMSATAFAQPDPRDSVILESKTVQPGNGHPYMTVKVYITNKDTLAALNLVLQTTSTSGGAYAIVARPRSFSGVINPLVGTLKFGAVTGFARYHSDSPDTFLVYAQYDPADNRYWEPPNSVRKALWEIKFDTVLANQGTMEMDSATYFGSTTVFVTANPVADLPVNFLKGIINVGAAGPFCLDSICSSAAGSFPYGQSYSFDFDCDEPGAWSVTSGPGSINPNTGLYTFDDACLIGVLPVTVRFTDTLGFFSECDFVMNATSPAFICAPDQETVWVSHGTLAQNQISAFQPPTGDGIVYTSVLGPGSVNSGGLWSHQAICADVSPSFPLLIRVQISDTVRGCPFGFLVDTCEFKLFVTNSNPEIANFPDSVVRLDTNATFSLQLIPDDLDPADSVLSSFLLSGPSGLTLSPSGFIEWTPTSSQAGLAEARIRVRDGCGVSRDYRLAFAVSSEVQRGDLNADGQFSPADVVALLNCVFLTIPPYTGAESCDMNCDGQGSPADVVLLIKWVFLGDPLPC